MWLNIDSRTAVYPPKKKHWFKDYVCEEATVFFIFEAFDCSTNVGRVLDFWEAPNILNPNTNDNTTKKTPQQQT